MYYWDLYEILKEKREEMTKNQLLRAYRKRLGIQANDNNVNKALAKLRRRDDIEFRQEGRIYFYKFIKISFE